MRNFEFTWYAKKDRQKINRHNKLSVNCKDSAEIGVAAKQATDVFCKTFGNLNQIEIISIQEYDKDGNPVGEVITPMEGSSIIPVSK